MVLPVRGLIEGFYGTPWSWDARVEVLQWCAQRGMTHYVYAPKDDPKHRDQWRVPYTSAELHGFERLVADAGLDIGFAISPGLSIDYASDDDRAALARKIDALVARGVRLICLALDDIPFRDGLGEDHADLTAWLREHLGARADLLLVPTEYIGSRQTPYLRALAEGVPADVGIGWTGESVVCDELSAEQARARAAALGGRAPLVWDNYPVNDGLMGDRLMLGPIRGRDQALIAQCCGYLANPMVQSRASKLPLSSIAALLRGDDPKTAWTDDATGLGWRTFAEACDGAVPFELALALAEAIDGPDWSAAAEPLARWLERARDCEAPGLEDEAGPWLEQARREARVGLEALRLVEASRPLVRVGADGSGRAVGPADEEAVMRAFGLVARWQRATRSEASVFGPRRHFRPALGQRDDGRWYVERAALVEGLNALDELVHTALACAAQLGTTHPIQVEANGAPVSVSADGRFAVAPGSTVISRWGVLSTRLRTPGEPPLGAASRLSSV
jgi:hyaluronoglucosaminidase